MYLSACLSYQEMTGTIGQEKDGIYLILRSEQLDVTLCFSYTQMKAMADGCNALLSKLHVQEFTQSNSNDLKGALQLEFTLPETETTAPQHESRTLSQSA